MNENKEFETILDKFRDVVSVQKNKIAVEFYDESITYGELDYKSSNIAYTLKKLGIEKNEVVGVMMNRSIELMVAIIGILKAGAVYLPLDIIYPEERINYILKDSKCKVLLTNTDINEGINFFGNVVDIRSLSEDQDQVLIQHEQNIEETTAYILYTSGSTGEPKGVPISHKALFAFYEGINKKIPFKSGDRILAVTTVSFDISILELLIPLGLGMTVVLADSKTGKNPRLLMNYISKKNINVIQMTPTRMTILLDSMKSKDWLDNVKMFLIGGESFPISLLEKLKNVIKSDAQIYNLYGPTESTIWVSVAELTNESQIHIGTPLAGSNLIILDENLKPVEIEKYGEICIIGKQLSNGYINKAELTKKRFINIDEFPGEVIYRTGDYGCELMNGMFLCKGRIDDQVKIRGYRVELNEVTQTLLGVSGVRNAAVVALDGKNDTKFLCAFYESDSKLDTNIIRDYMKKYLPYYMVPEKFEWTNQLPETLNQKIDKKVLMNMKKDM